VAFRSYVIIDWLRIFDDCSNNVENLWKKLKDMLLNGTTLFIPTACNFSTWKRKKWVRPIDREIKTKVKFKKKL